MSSQAETGNEIKAFRERLTALAQAGLRINESLDLDTVLQEVLDCARSLTGADYGIIALMDDERRMQQLLWSGISEAESRQLRDIHRGKQLCEYISRLQHPLRVDDFQGHLQSLGIDGSRVPIPAGPNTPFLAAPIIYHGETGGGIFLADTEAGRKFTPEDEETLMMFASQAALVIANARRYQEEQQARADVEALIDTSPVGVLVFDGVDGRIVSYNREVRRIANALYHADAGFEEVLSTLTIRRGDGRELTMSDFPIAETLRTGEAVRLEQMVFQGSNGRSMTIMVNATPIRSDDGVMRSFVVTLQDMTPIEDLERQRAEFLGMVSHELRMPLMSIKGSADTLLESGSDLDPAEVRQFSRIIRDQADRMRHMIVDLLDAARIETGTLSVTPEPVAVVEMVDEAKRRLATAGEQNNLQINLPPDLPLVMADQRRIVQVLNNLLTNAVESSRETPTILVSAEREEFHVAVSVTDDGPGVSAEQAPHVFRKFFHAEGEESGIAHNNTGLGLAICRGIVEAHGGRIWVESEGLGFGCRFTFTLPIVEPTDLAGAGASPLRGGTQALERAEVSILVVDDDPQTLRHVRDALSGTGYSVTVTADPVEALDITRTFRPDLAILDLVLPDGNGIELMQEMQVLADIPVIFLSAYGQDQVIAQAFEAGAADYVSKPFSPTELVARIRAELRRVAGPPANPTGTVVLGDLDINYDTREVRLAGKVLDLTATEYGLIRELSAAEGAALTYQQLLRRIWRNYNSYDPRVVRTHVGRLRRKLGDNGENPTYILTEPRVGYRMARPGNSGAPGE
ncbi:MAG: response regulator [Chloroflexi bacterium]|nr:response regulator [Chloroflexota bacterium]